MAGSPGQVTGEGAGTPRSISATMLIRDVVSQHPELVEVFTAYGLPCAGCHVSTWETVAGGAKTHRLDLDKLLGSLNAVLHGEKPVLPGPGARGRPLNVMNKPPRPAQSQTHSNIKHVIAV